MFSVIPKPLMYVIAFLIVAGVLGSTAKYFMDVGYDKATLEMTTIKNQALEKAIADRDNYWKSVIEDSKVTNKEIEYIEGKTKVIYEKVYETVFECSDQPELGQLLVESITEANSVGKNTVSSAERTVERMSSVSATKIESD